MNAKQIVMNHDHEMIGLPVHVYSMEWPEPDRPRAGFVDGYGGDKGLFSVTVEMSLSDQRRGMAPRVYLPNVLVIQRREHRPIGVERYAVLRSAIINQAAPSVTTGQMAVVHNLGPATDETPEPPLAKIQRPAVQPTAEVQPIPPALKIGPAETAPAAPKIGPDGVPIVLPPGMDDDGPDAPGSVGGPGHAPEIPNNSPAVGKAVIDQLMATPAWQLVAAVEDLNIHKATDREIILTFKDDDKPVARVFWTPRTKSPAEVQTDPYGFSIKTRDRGGRCSVTLAEHISEPIKVDAAVRRLAGALQAASLATVGDYGSAAANIAAYLAAH